MISEFYDQRVPQCDSANFVHGTPPDCCTGCTGDCPCWGDDWGASIAEIENNWSHWDFEYTSIDSTLSWSKLQNTIYCDKSPVFVIKWRYCGAPPSPVCSGHVVVAYGYAQIGNVNYVSYFDPWPPDCDKTGNVCSSVNGGDDVVTTYAAFVETGLWFWGDTIYDFSYTGD